MIALLTYALYLCGCLIGFAYGYNVGRAALKDKFNREWREQFNRTLEEQAEFVRNYSGDGEWEENYRRRREQRAETENGDQP